MGGVNNREQKAENRRQKTEGRNSFSVVHFLSIFCLLFSVFWFLHSCATGFDQKGKFHVVRKGETLQWIARSYRVSSQDLAEENGITDPKKINAGQKLYLPERRHKRRFKKLPFDEVIAKSLAEDRRSAKREPRANGKKVSTYHGTFQWPVQGRIMSGFGIRNGRRHDGIDISADSGTPIHAAGIGKVVFSGEMRGYGKLILIKHEGSFFTAYAHNSSNLKKEGESVKKGDVIAKVGMTGRATGPHLHFEVREGHKARNPLFFLPVVR